MEVGIHPTGHRLRTMKADSAVNDEARSYVRNEQHEGSDIDLAGISPIFEGLDFWERGHRSSVRGLRTHRSVRLYRTRMGAGRLHYLRDCKNNGNSCSGVKVRHCYSHIFTLADVFFLDSPTAET